MPYLHLDLPGTYPVEVKRELAVRADADKR